MKYKMILLAFFVGVLFTGCRPQIFGSQVNCSDISENFETAIPFLAIQNSLDNKWITSNYNISPSAIRFFSGTVAGKQQIGFDWTKGRTQYEMELAVPYLSKTWKPDITVDDVIRCMGNPQSYQAFKLADRYSLVLWYPKQSVEFLAEYRQLSPLPQSPFDLGSKVWTSVVVPDGDMQYMLNKANPNIYYPYFRDLTMLRQWPGDISKITIDYPDLHKLDNP